jgi:CHASE2 domain-containing sensor protein
MQTTSSTKLRSAIYGLIASIIMAICGLYAITFETNVNGWIPFFVAMLAIITFSFIIVEQLISKKS